MGLKNDAIPSSAAFDDFADVLSNEADKKDAIKKAGAIFAFNIKSDSAEDTWFLDLKKTGTVGKGSAPSGEKPTITLSVSDDNFAKLISGKANAQKLFMGGKLKVKGDVMKATKIEPILKKAQAKQLAKAKL